MLGPQIMGAAGREGRRNERAKQVGQRSPDEAGQRVAARARRRLAGEQSRRRAGRGRRGRPDAAIGQTGRRNHQQCAAAWRSIGRDDPGRPDAGRS